LRAWNGSLDVHTSRRAGDDDGSRRRPVDHDAQVQLAFDLEALLNEDAADLLPFRARLVRDQRHADHLLSELLGLGRRLRDLDAAPLAASAGVNLRLDDHNGAAEPPGDLARFGARERHLAARHGYAVAREHCLGLVFVDFHKTAVRR
jgi:hypothetical protein